MLCHAMHHARMLLMRQVHFGLPSAQGALRLGKHPDEVVEQAVHFQHLHHCHVAMLGDVLRFSNALSLYQRAERDQPTRRWRPGYRCSIA